MDDQNYIELTDFSGRNDFYLAMVGRRSGHLRIVDRNDLKAKGFGLLSSISTGRYGSRIATFHHYPTGSTVIMRDSLQETSTRITGNKKMAAAKALTELVRPYGFELKEEPRAR